jgi:hypothetical protein
MGYRADLYIIDNKDLKDLRSISKKRLFQEMEADDDFIYRLDILNHFNAKEIYSLGEPNWGIEFEVYLKPLFKNKLLHEYYNSDNDMMILTKEGLRFLIDFYHNKVNIFYKKQAKLTNTIVELISEIKKTKGKTIKKEKVNKIISDSYSDEFYFSREILNLNANTKGMEYEWEKDYKPYNLEGEKISDSWKYEYAIFELVRLYKTIDFKNKTLIYTAG